jgi:hypothetical protein
MVESLHCLHPGPRGRRYVKPFELRGWVVLEKECLLSSLILESRLRAREWYNITYRPLYAATTAGTPMNYSIIANMLHHRLALERMSNMEMMNPKVTVSLLAFFQKMNYLFLRALYRSVYKILVPRNY